MQLFMHKLISDRPIAVRFRSREEAQIFFAEMKRTYPKHCDAWSRAIYSVGEERRGGVCYCPYLNEKNSGMTHGSMETFIKYCITVIEFEELLYDDDGADVVESLLPVEFLLN